MLTVQAGQMPAISGQIAISAGGWKSVESRRKGGVRDGERGGRGGGGGKEMGKEEPG